jgi:hypothetical protein
MDDARRSARRKLLAIAALFFVPVIIAFAMYYGGFGMPSGSSSKGQLIDPPRPLTVSGLRAVDGSDAAAVFNGKWSLIYIGDGRCDDACRAALVYGRQSRLSLNEKMTRVQRVFLVTGNCCDRQYLDQEQPGLITLDASAPQAAAFLAQFPAERAETLFIVDPLGNLMMRHDARVLTSKDLLSDLRKLLKLSHIG